MKKIKGSSWLLALFNSGIVGLIVFAALMLGPAPCPGQSTSSQDTFSTINLAGLSENGVLALGGTNISAFKSFSNDELSALIGVLDATPTIPAASLPRGGMGSAFWSLQDPGMPPLPGDTIGVDVWPMSDGNFLLNDLNFDYDSAATQPLALRAMDIPAPPGFGDGDSGTNLPADFNYIAPDYGTNLWIAQTAVASGYLTAIGSNTISGTIYTIQTRTNLLLPSFWQNEGTLVGSAATNWTSFGITQGNRTNLFVRLRSEGSSDGSGLPDWWELQYFGMTGIDPNAQDSAGDGFTIYQKYVLSANPNSWVTPAAPRGFTVTYNAISNTATLNWLPCFGSVTGYTISDSLGNHYTASPGSISLTISAAQLRPNPQNNGNIQTIYSMVANYGALTSAATTAVPLEPANLVGAIVPGPQGILQLVVSTLPVGTAAIQLTEISESALNGQDTNFYITNVVIPVTNLTNGICAFPNWANSNNVAEYGAQGYQWVGRAVGTNGSLGAAVLLANENVTGLEDNYGTVQMAPPYVDGRTQLKQNLIFQLRAASMDAPVHFSVPQTNYYDYGPFGTHVGDYIYSPSYAYAGFYPLANNDPGQLNFDTFDPYLPVEENCLFRNFVFTPGNSDANGGLVTGVGGYIPGNLGSPGSDYAWLVRPLSYEFDTNSIVFPALLDASIAVWSFYEQTSESDDLRGMGLITTDIGDGDIGSVTMSGNFHNWFGLPYTSANVAYNDFNTGNLTTNVVLAGGTIYVANYDIYNVVESHIYPATVEPKFRTVEYDFWNSTPILNKQSGLFYPPVLPGNPSFSTSNAGQSSFIVGVGRQIPIVGYAKLEVTNSVYPGVYGYLGQYFDQAYIATNGVAAGRNTGILSPYGNFFATEPGVAALLTKPDIDTGEQGTCMVYCVSLVLDKNHDETMDGSFNGPDATSQANPMVWWINDDYDYSGASWNLGSDVQADWFYNDGYQRQIDSQRDLEDYARLWICGMPALTNASYQVSLSWTNVGSGSPTINLFDTVETNGGIGYLTNLDTATAEAFNYGVWGENRRAIATISPGQPFTFPSSYFTNAGDKHFLFDGAITNGNGELMLTIADGNGNTIAQTGAWLDLHHVDDFFEQAVITNNTSGAKSNWTSAVEMVQPAASSGLGDDQDLIILVHGINVKPWDCVNCAETVLKRLYWAGYHGKFAEIEWPCNLLTPIPSPLSPAVFNDSELKAYKASQALTTYLPQLRARFPGYRLHLLVHSQGNAVVSEAIRSGVTFDTYILTQGALPASAYDVDAPVDNDIAFYEGNVPTPEWQPMGYRGIYTNFTGRIVNFYNMQDGVLNYWITDQKLLKPSVYFDASYYFYDGTSSYFEPALGANYLVADPEESRADLSRSRTLPIGQSGPLSRNGVIQSAVDLNANFGFDSDISEHSAQWTRPIQTSLPYFQQVLRSCQIIPAP